MLHATPTPAQAVDGPIGTALAEMAFGCPPAVLRALRDAVDRGDVGYLLPDQVTRIAEATAAWVDGEHGWRLAPETIRPVADIVAGFRAVLTHFLAPGDPVIVPTPGYMPFLAVPPAIGRPVVEVPMRQGPEGWRYDIEGIRAAFRAGARMLVLCNPHNPIGKAATEAELAAIEAVVAEADGLVFSDEIHAPFVFAPRRHIIYAARSERAASHTITATSASKAFNIPGVKCGQLIFTNPAHLDQWRAIGRWYEHQTSSLGVAATEVAYRHGRSWLDEVVEYVAETMVEVTDVLQTAGVAQRCPSPEATYLLWIDLRGTRLARGSEGSLGQVLSDAAELVVTDGIECGAAGAGFVRFNAALPRASVLEGMRRFIGILGDVAA